MSQRGELAPPNSNGLAHRPTPAVADGAVARRRNGCCPSTEAAVTEIGASSKA